MPIQPRTRQLIFLMLWILFTVVFIIIGARLNWPISDRLLILLAALLGLAPALGGFVLVGVIVAARDDRLLRRGHDVYQEDAHVDDAGFIHLSAASASVNKHEETIGDVLSDAGTFLGTAGNRIDED